MEKEIIDEEKIKSEIEAGHDKKSFAKSATLGSFIGLATIVPGVSGSVIAIIFKLYNHLLYAISNIFKSFVKCFKFLLPIILGVIFGVVVGFITVKQLLNIFPFATILLFVGLMIGAFPSVKDEIKDTKPNAKLIILFVLGILIPIAISLISNFLNESLITRETMVETLSFGKAILFLFLGYVVAITQVVPGLSATAVLMAFGYFRPILNSVSVSFVLNNPSVLIIYGCLGVGFLVGLLTFTKFLTYMFKVAKSSTMYLIVGLSLGSIVSMLINSDMLAIYKSWSNMSVLISVDLILGLLLVGLGIWCGYSLVKYERKKANK